jgi:hypothetical protein
MDFGDLDGGQAGKDIHQISLGIQTPSPRAHQHGVNHRTAPSRVGMTDEQPSLAPHRRGSNVILDQVVVDLKASVLEISELSLVLVEKVVDRLAHRTLGEQLGL